jgi:NAD(P)-dependent dehydrogenase (short-subunit alcohol dehydrogenase family)
MGKSAMDLGLQGTVVLITGGSKGIGLACARQFLSEGARIAIASRDPEHLRQATQALQGAGAPVLAVSADLGDPMQASSLVRQVNDELGPIGVLVNSAGAARRTPPAELTAQHWHAAMAAKFFPYMHAIDAVLPGMVQNGGGAIVNIVGTGGKMASPVHLPGGSANAALMLASAGLGNAYAAKGVRVNAVNPGITATSRMREGLEAEARSSGKAIEDILSQRVSALPMGRVAAPEEVADVVVFLASRRAAYVNGAVLTLDGAATPIVV